MASQNPAYRHVRAMRVQYDATRENRHCPQPSLLQSSRVRISSEMMAEGGGGTDHARSANACGLRALSLMHVLTQSWSDRLGTLC